MSYEITPGTNKRKLSKGIESDYKEDNADYLQDSHDIRQRVRDLHSRTFESELSIGFTKNEAVLVLSYIVSLEAEILDLKHRIKNSNV